MSLTPARIIVPAVAMTVVTVTGVPAIRAGRLSLWEFAIFLAVAAVIGVAGPEIQRAVAWAINHWRNRA